MKHKNTDLIKQIQIVVTGRISSMLSLHWYKHLFQISFFTIFHVILNHFYTQKVTRWNSLNKQVTHILVKLSPFFLAKRRIV